MPVVGGSTRSRVILVVTLIAAFVVGGARAARADDGLEVSASARYEVVPDAERLDVSIHYLLTNRTPNGRENGYIVRYYYNAYAMVIPDDAVDLRAVDENGSPLVVDDTVETISGGEMARVATVHFRALYYNKTRDFTLTFGIPGGAPRSDSYVRVNPSYAAFTVWAWGDPGESDVVVAVPEAFDSQISGGLFLRSIGGGYTTWYYNGISNPATWSAFVTARDDAALDERVVTWEGLDVHVRSWPGDDTWSERVVDVVTRGLPELQAAIGLDFGNTTDLDIIEALDPALVGYAGWYLNDSNTVEMGEDLDDHITLHEISHFWFNRDLFDGRWITEGLADEFAHEIVTTIEGESDPAYETLIEPVMRGSIPVPLEEWTLPTRSLTDDQTAARENFGYDASFWVIHTLLEDIGPDATREVLHAAANDLTAYRVDGVEPEKVKPKDDWRRLLDLLDEVGHSTKADDVFREFVLDDEHDALLDSRALIRADYAALAAAAGDWQTPWVIRKSMGLWDFADAQAQIGDAREVIDLRDQIESAAAPLGITPPTSLEGEYEHALFPVGLFDASQRGKEQLAVLTTVVDARAAIDAPRSLFTRIGLWGQDPMALWAGAAAAFEADDLDGAATVSEDVAALIADAARVGRTRVVWASSGFVVFAGLVTTGTVLIVRRSEVAPVAAGDDPQSEE